MSEVPFLARDDEQDRFCGVLDKVLATQDGRGDGFLVLVHGLGGIGKSTLLRRYEQIVRGETPRGKPFAGQFLLARVDWQERRAELPADYPPEGPPLWRVLYEIYSAVQRVAHSNRRSRRAFGKAFNEFRERVLQAKDERFKPQPSTTALENTQAILGATAGAATLLSPEARILAEGIRLATTGALEAEKKARGTRVDANTLEAAVRVDDALVRSFSQALRDLSSKTKPFVLSLDTSEILGESRRGLFRVMELTGPRVVWVVAQRLEPENQAGEESVSGLYLGHRKSDSIRSVAPGNFTVGDVNAYLTATLGEPLPRGVTPEKVRHLTHGTPLAVRLVVNLLRKGMEPDEALSEVTSEGDVSEVINGLALRYLMHVTAAEVSAPDGDLLRIYGLALLDGSRDDPELLAALWDAPPGDMAGLRQALSMRHDFVVSGRSRLHQEVRDAVRLFLLNPEQRLAVKAANERAVEVLRRRLDALPVTSVEAQFASDAWCGAASALLWHTFWVDDWQGLRLLGHLLPAAMLHRPDIGRQLLAVARWFSATAAPELRIRVASLHVLTPAASFLAKVQAAFREGTDEATIRSRVREAVDVLEQGCSYTPAALAGDATGAVLLGLVRAQFPGGFGLDTLGRLDQLVKLDEELEPVSTEPGKYDKRLASLAENLVSELRKSPERLEQAVRAQEISIRRTTENSMGSSRLAWFLGQLGRHEDALRAIDRALHIDPDAAWNHNYRGYLLRRLGRIEEGLAATDEAIALNPDVSLFHYGKGHALQRLGRLEEAVAEFGIACDLDPSEPRNPAAQASPLVELGRPDDAIASCDEALAIDPDYADARANKGWALMARGDLDAAEAELRTAAEAEGADSLHARVLLAALRFARSGASPQSLCESALQLEFDSSPAFFWGELRAVAQLLLGETDAAEAELRSVVERREPGDTFDAPLYALLASRPISGIERLLAVWEELGVSTEGVRR